MGFVGGVRCGGFVGFKLNYIPDLSAQLSQIPHLLIIKIEK